MAAVLKVLTFVPVLVLLYYSDLPSWYQFLESQHLLFFLAGALTLLGYGIFLKRKILSCYLETPRMSFLWGFALLFASILLYLIGTFYFDRVTFHIESLVVLCLSYSFLRIDRNVSRQLISLAAIIALTVSLPLVSDVIGETYSVFFVTLLNLGLFAFYVDTNLQSVVLPTAMTGLEIVTWFFGPGFPGSAYLIFGIPAIVAIPMIFSSPRERFQLPSAVFPSCTHDQQGVNTQGFCLACGRKIRAGQSPSSLNLTGFVVVFVIIAVLLTVQIPFLAVSGGLPRSEVASFSGTTVSGIPVTPPGWFVNVTHVLNEPGDDYAMSQVIAPTYHPERANYTIYYELSSTQSNPPITNSWGYLPGWNQSRLLERVGPLSGSLTTYTSTDATMLVYSGSATMLFLNLPGSNQGGALVPRSLFPNYRVGFTIVRTFQGTNVSEQTTMFMSDVASLFGQSLGAQASDSDWTNYLNQMYETFNSVGTFVATLFTSALIVAGTYYVKSYDSRLDSIVREASDLNSGSWVVYSWMFGKPQSELTAIDISQKMKLENNGSYEPWIIEDILRVLEKNRLVKRVLSVRGRDIILGWKVVP